MKHMTPNHSSPCVQRRASDSRYDPSVRSESRLERARNRETYCGTRHRPWGNSSKSRGSGREAGPDKERRPLSDSSLAYVTVDECCRLITDSPHLSFSPPPSHRKVSTSTKRLAMFEVTIDHRLSGTRTHIAVKIFAEGLYPLRVLAEKTRRCCQIRPPIEKRDRRVGPIRPDTP